MQPASETYEAAFRWGPAGLGLITGGTISALAIDPGNAPLWSAMAQLEAAEGDLAAARAAYTKGLEENPTNVPLLHALGRLELNAGNTLEARSLLRRALEVEPSSPAVLRELSAIDAADGKEAQSERLLARADVAWAAGNGARGKNKGGGRRKRWRNGMDDPEDAKAAQSAA